MVYRNRIRETSVTPGTGPLTLAGAVVGFQAFSVLGDGASCAATIEAVDSQNVPTGDWEVSLCTVSAGVLTRVTPLESSNGGSLVNFGAGTKNVFCMPPYPNGVTWELMQQASALSVLGRSANSIGNLSPIVGANVGDVMQVLAGPTIGFGAVPIANPAIVLIEEQSPSGVGVVTFSSLGSYTHLKIFYDARGDQSATSSLMNLQFNGDTGSNYDAQRSSFNTGSGLTEQIAATSGIIGAVTAATGAANYSTSGEITIPNYRNTTFYKSAMSQIAGPLTVTTTGNLFSRIHSVWWRSTAAVASITLTLASGNYVAGTKFSLYGVN